MIEPNPLGFDPSQFRVDYSTGSLEMDGVDPDPFRQFDLWFEDASRTQPIEPNAVVVATATSEGLPSARIVLLKGFDDRGFVFYTNYESRKGEELEQNPNVALLFYWDTLQRQVRIEGTVEKVSREESATYFRSRPLDARIGAWVSQQSAVIADRSILEDRMEQARARFGESEIPLPPFWGGVQSNST